MPFAITPATAPPDGFSIEAEPIPSEELAIAAAQAQAAGFGIEASLAQPFPLFVQWQLDGTDLGEPDVAIVDFTGEHLEVTRGTGENSHVITVRTTRSVIAPAAAGAAAGATVVGATAVQVTNVVLLLHFDGADGASGFVDSSPVTNPVFTGFDNAAVPMAVVDTGTSKFGSGSVEFPNSAASIGGDNERLSCPPVASTHFRFTGPYTMECWVYLVAGSFDDEEIFVFISSSAEESLYVVRTGGNAGKVRFTVASPPGLSILSLAALPAGQWIHLAATRDASNVVRFFVDGVSQGSVVDTSTPANARIRFGGQINLNTNRFRGRIDEVRVVNGFAHYTSNFTPPAVPFP